MAKGGIRRYGGRTKPGTPGFTLSPLSLVHAMTAFLRLSLGLALAAALSTPARAQVGVTGGANFSDLSDARTADFDQSTGWHVGVFVQAKLPVFGLRASVLYMDAGDAKAVCAPVDPEAFCTDILIATPVSLVSVPLDLQLRVPLGLAAVYVAGGPDLRFPIEDGRPVFDASQVNVAASGAVGAELANLFLELRYARDVTGYADELGVGTTTDYELNTVMLRAGIGL